MVKSSSVTSGCLVVGSFLGSWRPNAGAVDGSDGAVRDRGSDSSGRIDGDE
jgi:hypothetical protein